MKTVKTPSVKRLMEAFSIDKRKAELIRHAIKYDALIEGDDNYPKTNAWIASQVKRPAIEDWAMEAINEVLDGPGVDEIFRGGEVWSDIKMVCSGDSDSDNFNIIIKVNGKYRLSFLDIEMARYVRA